MSKIGNIKLPTLAGVTVLLLATIFGVVLANNKQVFMIGATPEVLPKDVRISNINHDSFTVSWTTDKRTLGFVHLEEEKGGKVKTGLNEQDEASHTHHVTLNSLTPETAYNFYIFSDGYKFDFNGIPWQVKTPQTYPSPPPSRIAAGKIITGTGAGVGNAIIYITAGGGSLLSTTSDQDGKWIIPISKSRDINLENFTPINEDTLLQISIQAGPDGTASADIYAPAAVSTPSITIGQTHDFKSLITPKEDSLPVATIEVPIDTTIEAVPEESPIKVSYPGEGDAVLTTRLILTGSAPAGQSFSLQLQPMQSVYNIKTGSDGNWTWSPNERLPGGQYSALIRWTNEEGKLWDMSHNFLVKSWQQNEL